jgi:hypothetical protein
MPPIRVAMASPQQAPAVKVARQDGIPPRAIAIIASSAHVITAMNGTSLGVKKRWP